MLSSGHVEALSRLRDYVDTARSEVLAGYAEGLRKDDNPLGRLPDDQLQQVVTPLIDVLVRPRDARDTASQVVGRSRALQLMNPVNSLRGASVLHDTTADVIARGATELNTPCKVVIRMLRDLHSVILQRVTDAAVPYAGVLLQQITDAYAAERARIARDLHDRSAHALALAFQQLEVRNLRLAHGDTEGAEKCLEVLHQQLQDAATLIRDLAQDLGSDHTKDGLEAALHAYLESDGSGKVRLDFDHATGGVTIPAWVREQAFLSIREAVRNAVLHSGSEEITVHVAVRFGNLVAVVRDAGVGFAAQLERPAESGSSGNGLRSMVERVEQLGGSAMIDSNEGSGTVVELVVPLP